MILFYPITLVADLVNSARYIVFSIITRWVNPGFIIKSGCESLGGFRKANLHTQASFAFMEVVTFPSESLKADIILICNSLIYITTCQ